MTNLEAILLGLVQGFTEFFPVSSSGHLVMGQALLGVEMPGILFEIVVHLATLLSVLLVYRSRVGGLATGALKGEGEAWRYLVLLALATLPAAAVGLSLGDRIEALFQRLAVVGVALLFTGAVLWSTRIAVARRQDAGAPAGDGPSGDGSSVLVGIGWKVALLIGMAQSLALIPGVSRSGMTVAMALWLGVGRERAAEFAFLMLVPAVSGAVILHLPDLVAASRADLAAPLLWGGLAAATAGVLAIRLFVALVRQDRFHVFAPYCWAVGTAFLLYLQFS